jgi:hypothetical protein
LLHKSLLFAHHLNTLLQILLVRKLHHKRDSNVFNNGFAILI